MDAGTVRELTVSQSDVCPSGSRADSSVVVSGVTSGVMKYNGVSRDAVTYRTNCADVIVGDTQDDMYE